MESLVSSLSTFEYLFLTFSIILVVVLVILEAVLAFYGIDNIICEMMREGNPKRFRKIVREGRFNGPLMILMCSAFIIAAPFHAFSKDGSVTVAIGTFACFSLLLWLSIRSTRWARNVDLEEDDKPT